MPRPKPSFDVYDDLFVGIRYSVDTNNFNKNTKITITCEHGHTYITSITKIESLGHNYKECPHCKKSSTNESKGISYSVVDTYAKQNNLSFTPIKDYYNRWKDTITFTCIHDGDVFEVKSLAYWEDVTSKQKYSCKQCEINKLGLLDNEEFHTNINNINDISGSSVYFDIPVDTNTLTPVLKSRIESQDKWRLVEFTNTKNKCMYQCNTCGNKKKCSPFNIFTKKGAGCAACNALKTVNKRKHKVVEICKNNNIIIKGFDAFSNFEFKCNKCGAEFSKKCIIGGYEEYNLSCPECYKITRRKSQTEVESYVNELGYETISEYKGFGCEIDIYIPSKKIAIEYCGLVWHSTKYKKDKLVHKKKLDICGKSGIRLITMFEDEWITSREICESRIKSMLGSIQDKIHGRKCEVRVVENKEALAFCKENHIQGKGQSNTAVGLFYKGEMVSVMTFSKPSVSKSATGYDWELNRFCSKIGYIVNGGACKMLNYFKKDKKDQTIVTFADLRWATGNVYEKIGFSEIKETSPNYYYFGKLTGYTRKHRFNFTKQKLLKLHGLSCSDLTEYDLADLLGLYRIYDCGHKKYILNI
jgi:hypothetical protein